KSFGHAKRRARVTAAMGANKPPPGARRSIGFNERMDAGGHNSEGVCRNADSGGRAPRCRDGPVSGSNCEDRQLLPGTAGEPAEAEVDRNNRNDFVRPATLSNGSERIPRTTPSSRHPSNVCPSCRIVVLGHPLDTISTRCGGGMLTRSSQGAQSPSGSATTKQKAVAYRAVKRDGLAVGTDIGWKQAGVGNHTKSTLRPWKTGAIAAAGAQLKRTPAIGAAAVSQARPAVETVAEQLGSVIQERCSKHDAGVIRIAELHARGKQAKELKLDRKIDFRRRLAAAADEARQETETVALRRRLLHGQSSDTRTSRGGGVIDASDAYAVVEGAEMARAETLAGHDLGDNRKRDEDVVLVKPDAVTTAAVAEAVGATSALSLERWNQQQKKEEARRLQELITEMKDAVDNGEMEGDGRRPTFRRGSSCGSSRSGSTSGRGSISGSGIYRDLARGADAAHSAILSSMRVDGMDGRTYLQERRRVFHTVATDEEEQRDTYFLQAGNEAGDLESSSTGGTTDWESATEPSFRAAGGGRSYGQDDKLPGLENVPRSGGSGGGRVGEARANTSTTGTGGGTDDASAGTTDEVVMGIKARAVARDAEQLRLARARRAAKEERLQIEKREAIEAERGARRRAKDRTEAARNERKARSLARKEMRRREEALDLKKEQAR
ncbi:unnamed protein product, partial [Hapterophycus canaliculatus]